MKPRDAKHDLAYTLVDLYHSKEAAEGARNHFETTVIQKKIQMMHQNIVCRVAKSIEFLISYLPLNFAQVMPRQSG